MLVSPLQVLFATGAVLIEQWLTSLPAARAPLAQGIISTTEPADPGSDPVWLGTTAVKDGSDYGSGAMMLLSRALKANSHTSKICCQVGLNRLFCSRPHRGRGGGSGVAHLDTVRTDRYIDARWNDDRLTAARYTERK